jgi:ABC-type multidrug transport system fused ATPase/permease subunit
MSSRISKEVSAIQEGIGRKYGVVLYSYCMCLAGFTTGLYKGWSLALAMLGIAPIMLVGMGCFGSVMQKRTVESMKAYGQSAGYAEQALSAIRIVVSFG